MGTKQSDYRKRGSKREEFSPSKDAEKDFEFRLPDMGENIRKKLTNPLSEKEKEKVRKLQKERWEKKRKEGQKKTSSSGGSKHGGNRMYDRRSYHKPLRPNDALSAALETAAEQMIEARSEPKGEQSEKYEKAKEEFDRVLGIQQRVKSPKYDSFQETRKTAFSVQQEVIRGEVDENVLRVIAKAIKMEYSLVSIAVAVRNVRMELINKGVDLAKEGVTDKADPQSLEKLLVALRKNGLEKEGKYLAGNMSHKWLRKMEIRMIRKLILDRKPELADWLEELPLTRKSELTQEYIGKLLGGLKIVGDAHQYKILTLSVPEGWRRPTFPKKKVEKPSTEKKETVEKSALEKKEVKKTSKEKGAKAVAVKVEDLELGLVAKVLKKAGYPTLAKIKEAGLEKVSTVNGVGTKTVETLKKALDAKKA